jgi:hypothetical protein
MVDVSEQVVATKTVPSAPVSAAPRRRPLGWVLAVVAAVGLFVAYLRLARTVPVNADGASNSLQAWDMLHGNVLLRGWSVTDVPFYTTEVPQHMLVALVVGYNSEVVHVAAAMSYTLLVLLIAVLAKGRARGVEGWARMALSAAVVLVPAPKIGTLTVLSSPNHTGTCVPVLVTWLVLDRVLRRRGDDPPRWLPWAIMVLLVWGQVGDPLVTFVGVLPLVAVCGWRLLRAGVPWSQRWHGLDAQLIAAGFGSVLVADLALKALHALGGFHVHGIASEFGTLDELHHRAWATVVNTFAIFGAYFPDKHSAFDVTLGIFGVLALVATFVSVGVVVVRLVRRRPGERGDLAAELLAAGVVATLAAYLVSTLPDDLGGSREIISVLLLGAPLVGRLAGRLVRVRRVAPAVLAVAVVLCGALAVRASAPPVPNENADVAAWLVANDLRSGIGSYWTANNITLATSGRVRVAPVTGRPHMGYRWESKLDWYDPARADARFIVLDLRDDTDHGTVLETIKQFGPPVRRKDFGRYTVLVFDHNLLVGLPALCGPNVAPSMADCASK